MFFSFKSSTPEVCLIFLLASTIVDLIKLQYKSIDLLASSLPGIGKSIPSGSELVSNTAIIGIPIGIPIIAVLDTNSDPDGIDFPIPGNDDARRSIDLYCSLIKSTIVEANKNIKQTSGVEDLKEKNTLQIEENKTNDKSQSPLN